MRCTELDARLEAVASAAAPLPSRLPRVRDPVLGRWMAHQMDALLRNVTAGYGALDVAIGEGLDALNVGACCAAHQRLALMKFL